MTDAPTAVLFACNLNRVRSPMAAGLTWRTTGGTVLGASCGVSPDPADADGGLDPFVVVVMRELGVDLEGHRFRGFPDFADASLDLVVSLSAEAHRQATAFGRPRGIPVEFWPIDDPTQAGGSRETILSAYREVRGDIERRIRARFVNA